MKKLYNLTLNYAAHPKAPWALFFVAFAESSFFPIPPDVLLIPMVLMAFNKAFKFAAICTLGSVLGGITGYAIGYYGFEAIGQPVIDFYHAQHKFEQLQAWYEEFDIYIVGAAGFSPIPYKIFTILSGFMQADLPQFVVVSTISRGARFFLVAYLLYKGGEKFKSWIEANFYILTTAVTIGLLALVIILKVIL